MDPLMHAAQQFVAQVRQRLNEDDHTMTRLTSLPSYRTAVIKSLDLLQWQESNRWPIVRIDSSVELSEILRQIEGDYQGLRDGLAEDDITIAPLAISNDLDVLPEVRALYSEDEAAAAHTTERIAQTLAQVGRAIVSGAGEHIDGIVLALVPPLPIQRPKEYRRLIRHLESRLHDSARLLAYDSGEVIVAPNRHDVAFEVDEKALADFFKTSAARSAQRMSGSQSKETSSTPNVPSNDVSTTLRMTLNEAGELLAKGDFTGAAANFRSAKTLCRLSALVSEEATMLVAMGSAYLAGQDIDRALHAFVQAEAVTEKSNLGTGLQLQALLGHAGALKYRQDWAGADGVYQKALTVAARDDKTKSPALLAELWHQRIQCSLQHESDEVGKQHIEQVIDIAEQADDGQVAKVLEQMVQTLSAVSDKHQLGAMMQRLETARVALEARCNG